MAVPMSSLLASAKRLTSQSMSRSGTNVRGWQEDAWEMYDLVGEERFLATTLAGRIAQARLFVGKLPADSTEDPVPVEDVRITEILDSIGHSPAVRAQIVLRMAINLFVAGEGWLVGIPRTMLPDSLRPPMRLIDNGAFAPPPIDDETSGTSLTIEDLEWRMLSVSEIAASSSGEVTITLGQGQDEKLTCLPDDIFLIRVWRPHPRRWWEADSPTRSSLPVLRELVGLTMHISAQVDSRLAGAGLLIVPQSAQRSLRVESDTADTDSDPFTEALMEAMIRPISDRANASALVPLVVTVPDEVTGSFEYLTFAKPLDTEARNLRDEAIRRLALGQDAPPELLLGTAGMNHWGAWLVREDVVTTHIEPPLSLICDALTTQYLWPVLMDNGMTEEQAHQYVVWHDVSHMVMRPNRSADAMALYQVGALSDATLRASTGFDDSDAPPSPPVGVDEVSTLALKLVLANPGLIASPGLDELVSGLRSLLGSGVDLPSRGPAPSEPSPLPDTENAPAAEV